MAATTPTPYVDPVMHQACRRTAKPVKADPDAAETRERCVIGSLADAVAASTPTQATLRPETLATLAMLSLTDVEFEVAVSGAADPDTLAACADAERMTRAQEEGGAGDYDGDEVEVTRETHDPKTCDGCNVLLQCPFFEDTHRCEYQRGPTAFGLLHKEVIDVMDPRRVSKVVTRDVLKDLGVDLDSTSMDDFIRDTVMMTLSEYAEKMEKAGIPMVLMQSWNAHDLDATYCLVTCCTAAQYLTYSTSDPNALPKVHAIGQENGRAEFICDSRSEDRTHVREYNNAISFYETAGLRSVVEVVVV